jgi:hypothetical protein
MKINKKTVIGIFLFFFMATFLFTIEVKEGRIKLVLHENMGRFSLYYLPDLETSQYIPFLVTDDPRTSYVSIVVNDKVYKLGESGGFKETAEQISGGAQFTWVSDTITITQKFLFVSSLASPFTDGVQIVLSITNNSKQELKIAVRYLFDTYLGEKINVHFTTNKLVKLSKETLITKSDAIKYWISPMTDAEVGKLETGLQCATQGQGITTPDKIIFANWKRLSDTSWAYTASSSRSFSNLPYSVNDSSVCQYYDPKQVKPGAKFTVSLILGNVTSYGFQASETSTDTQAETTESDTQDLSSLDSLSDYEKVLAIIKTLNSLMAEIDKKIAAGEQVSAEDLELMNKLIAELEKRSVKYSGQ